MSTLYVATSKTLQEWGADVGLGKNLYKVGLAVEVTPDQDVAGLAGQSDWKVLKTQSVDWADDTGLLERLEQRDKPVDPNYYPKLRGARGIVKANLPAIENNLLVALTLDGKTPPKNFKVKPADVATFLISRYAKG